MEENEKKDENVSKLFPRIILSLLVISTVFVTLARGETSWLSFVNCGIIHLFWANDFYFDRQIAIIEARIHRLMNHDQNLILWARPGNQDMNQSASRWTTE